MYDTIQNINRFLISRLERIAQDLPDDRLGQPGPGGIHPPVWTLGHLAFCGEWGQTFFGNELKHANWGQAFGPGSSDQVERPEAYPKQELLASIREEYPRLAGQIESAAADQLARPHGLALLQDSEMQTVGDVATHLLTSHFAFHVAQLSAWRRAAGHAFLF